MLLVVLLGMVGCSSTSKNPHMIQSPAATGKKTVAVMAVDQRAMTAKKTVTPDHLGEVGGAFGNPFTLTTEKRTAVSVDLTESLTEGFRRGGWRTAPASAVATLTKEAAFRNLQTHGADRFLIVALKNWESDTLASTNFRFDLEVSVLDANGQVLAVERVQGQQNLGYPKYGRLSETIRAAMDAESSRVLSTALAKPALVAALR